MCGIAGHIGDRTSGRITVGALEAIQHRGQDSTGLTVAKANSDEFKTYRCVGPVKRFKGLFWNTIPAGHAAIGHVRMATHGDVTPINAHPLRDCSGDISVVHNGVITNWFGIREQLEACGHAFRSETDSEVVPHLIEEYYEGDLEAAIEAAMSELLGSATILVMHKHHPDRIVGATNGYPLSATITQFGTTIASEGHAVKIAGASGKGHGVDRFDSGLLITCFADSITTRKISLPEPTPFQVSYWWDTDEGENTGWWTAYLARKLAEKEGENEEEEPI
jgi:glucosamine--fructose-6-phosphate aminotransferase (isomerizing)